MMNPEVWKDIHGYEGLYQVSNQGRVRSLDRNVYNVRTRKMKHMKGKVLALCDANKSRVNYQRVSLSKENCVRSLFVHRLVANAFVYRENGKTQVNHIDGNKKNNNAENLEWVTPKENTIHAFSHSLCGHAKPVTCLDDGKTFSSISEAGRYYAFGGNAIGYCCNGKRKTAHKIKFKFSLRKEERQVKSNG
ncbi:NUMOD4 motif-containing HNH endonuclease [Caproiciproducens sp.]